jgi:hypothetical protein
MPGASPQTSTRGLTQATLPYALSIANKGWEKACADNPALEKQYNALLTKMGVQVSLRDTRQFNFGLIQFLLYILLPTVIFIILILLYVRHVQNSKLIEAAAKAALVNNTATSDSIPIIVPQTTEEHHTTDNKIGGSISDLLGFLSYLRFF